MADSTSSVHDQVRVERERNQARGEHLQTARRAADAERAYQAAVSGNTDAVRKFIRAIDDVGPAHDRASKQVRDFRKEVTDTERTVRVLSNSITSILLPALKGMAIAGGVGALGGLAGLLGAGGIQGIVAVTAALAQLSGVIALLPAVVGGAAVVLGTLAVAFHGVSDALGAAMSNDPKKFAEAIKDMGPATRSVIKDLASFTQSFKGAMSAVQDAFFRPMVGMIAPLVQQWLPALMQAGQQVASILGEAGRAVGQWLQQTSTMQGFQEFIRNIAAALERMLPAIQPIADAFLRLAVVGSQFFPQIADTIVKIANAFNEWVQGAAASGSLQRWIQGALDGFSQLWTSIKNVLDAAQGIGDAFNAAGSQGFLQWLVSITAEFKNWVESAKGAAILTQFFADLHQASVILGPILRIVGEAVLVLVDNLVKLGISMGPGITTFFQSLSEALGILGQALVASGPALSSILATLGQVLLQLVQSIGPQLPGLFKDLASVIIDLAPSVATLASALATLLSHLTPTEIEIVLGLVVAMQGLATVIPLVVGAVTGLAAIAAVVGVGLGTMTLIIVGVIAVVAALVVGIVLLVTHWQEVKSWVARVWEDLKGFAAWLGSEFMERIHAIGQWFTDVWKNIREGFSNIISEALQWGVNLIKNFIDGLINSIPGLRQSVDFIASIIPDFLKTGSPAKMGPLHDNPPDVMGKSIAESFTEGLTSGTSGVSGAAGGMAGALTQSTSAGTGVNPNFGGGKSGFNAFVDSLVQDLSAFSSIIKNSFGLFTKIADIFVNSTKIVASLWNKGDNPMTQPGGIWGPPATPEQQVPGVPQAEQHGVAPMPELVPGAGLPGGTPVVPQVDVAGVPKVGPGGGTPATVPLATPNLPAAAAAPAPAPVGAPGSVPLKQNPDGTWTSPNPAWAALIKRESGGRNIPQGITDANGGPGDPNAAQGIFQITPSTWRANGGEAFAPNPMAASPQDQAMVASRILASDPGAWGFYRHPGREDPAALRAGLTPIIPTTPPTAPPPGATAAGATPTITDDPTAAHGGKIDPKLFLVHTEEGKSPSAQALASSMEASGDKSYNYVIDPNTGAVVRPVPAGEAAWSVGSPGNQESINAVVAGSTVNWTKEQWLQHDAALNSLAFLAARDAAQFGIPITQLGPGSQSGIGGHDWVSQNLGGTDHTDPGPNFPWQEFMGRVRGFAAPGGTTPPVNVTATTAPAPNSTQGGNRTSRRPQPQVAPASSEKHFGVNPASRARIPLHGTTTEAVAAAGLKPLYQPGTTNIPPEIQQFASAFGLEANTYSDGGSLHQAGFAFDFTGKPEDMDRFASFIYDNLGPQTLELIHATAAGGPGSTRYGIAGGQQVDRPGQMQYFDKGGVNQYTSHSSTGPGAHVHWATDVPPVLLTGDGQAVPVVGSTPPGGPDGTFFGPGAQGTAGQPPPGSPFFGPGAQGPPVAPPAPGAPFIGPAAQPGAPPAGTPPVLPGAPGSPGQPLPGQPGSQGQTNLPFGASTPMGAFQGAMGAASSVVGDAMAVFDNMIKSIQAQANVMDMLVRGPSSTEDIMSLIDNLQQHLITAASVAKLVGSVGSLVGGASGGMDMGAGAAMSAIAGMVQGAIEAVNMSIDLGQEVWHQVSKYGAILAGHMLGGDIGFLGGNVRMLLNTATGDIQAYSEDNPQNKAIHHMPDWMARSYGGLRPELQQPRVANVNIYAGTGQSPRDMMNESMWLVGNSGSAASIAAVD